MSDPDALTEAQFNELRDDLVALIASLTGSIGALAEGSKPVELGEPIGRLSRMEAIQQQKMTAASHARARLRLKQAKAAYLLMDGEDYGYCRRCDDPIGYPRLKARPETPLCIACQSSLEG